ncbi:hypothetical protein [Kitasatospora sp. NPDC057223]|uniref:hypothetical protein n=1 Tax=Kitasatospora sp. NPDC057223 TaxID=3346055 RepID=UPI0036458FC4
MTAVTVETTTELPQYRRGTRNLTTAQRLISEILADLADALYEDSPKMTREESVETAARLLGDRPTVLLRHAQDLWDAHTDLTWNQAMNGAAMRLGNLQPPPTGIPRGLPRGFRIDALALIGGPGGSGPSRRSAGPDRVNPGPDPRLRVVRHDREPTCPRTRRVDEFTNCLRAAP